MSDGMLGGTYPTACKIGVGKWAGNFDTPQVWDVITSTFVGMGTTTDVLTDDPAIASAGCMAVVGDGCCTDYDHAINVANNILAQGVAPKQIAIVVTDTVFNAIGVNQFNAGIEPIAVYAHSGAALLGCSIGAPPAWVQNTINLINQAGQAPNNIPVCQGGAGANLYNVSSSIPASLDDVAQQIVDGLIGCDCDGGLGVPDIPLNWDPIVPCSPVDTDPIPKCASCECPDGYTEVPAAQPCNSLLPPTCKRVICECPPIPVLDPSQATTWLTGNCDDLILAGTPGYVNADPQICHWEYEQCVPANYTVGGIWKHNIRNDLFTNYYGDDYPWEITLIENTGQVVNTLRSIEYQMEAYVYKNFNLPRPQQLIGTDRFHDLDWNFDEAVVYNSEQVSGLLTLDLTPKNNIVLLNTYPIINDPIDIQILYSKEEQKYRFNQFWDITDDRGEFTGVERPIWITTLNGYIKTLNQFNLNYLKAAMQHKKFRHYYNMVLLRKNVSGDRKMLLKLSNSKMNISFR